MKAPWVERFWFWFCDTFGHAKSGSRNAEWEHDGHAHYDCTRCGRIVSTPTPSNAEAAEAIEHLCADLADALGALPQAVRNERERCAKLCEEEACSWDEAYPRNDFEAGPQDGCDGCAARIRGA